MRDWFERLSIRIQIALLVAAVALPLGAMVAWLLVHSLQEARRTAYAKVELVASATAEDLTQYLHQTEDVMRRLASREQVRTLDPAHCDPLPADYVVLQPEFAGCSVRDLDTEVVCTCRPDAVRRAEPKQFPRLTEALKSDRFYATGLIVSPRLGPITIFVQPILDDKGRKVGFLDLPVDLERLGQRLLAQTPPGAEVTVLDRTQAVLMRSARTLASPAGNASAPVQAIDEDRIVARRVVPGVGWTVAAAMPAAEVLAGYHALARETAWVGAGVLVLAVLLSARRAAAIARPMSALAETAKAAATGDTVARADPAGPAEVATVAHEINRMLDARHFSEARLRGVIDSATDAILTADGTQTIVMANPAAARMFGCTQQDLLGSALEQWIPPRFRARHRSVLQAFGESEESARAMNRERNVLALRADGTEFAADAAISHVEVGSQRLYSVILRDITERRRTEEALRESEARTRRLMSLLPHAVFVDSDGRFAFVNPAAQRLFDLDESRLIGRPVLERVHPDSVAAMQATVAALRQGSAPASPTEIRVLRADGGVRLVESVATWFEDRGSTSLLVVLHDITELKQAQIALRESHADLRRLVEAQDKLLENERRRVARELHDDLQQTLAAIRIDLGAIAELTRTDPAAAAVMLAEIDDLAAAAIASTRRIVNDLRPRMLEDLGLGPALEALAAAFQQRTGIAIHVDADPRASDAALASTATTICLYRVAQESLNNVAKHAQAHSAAIDLEYTDDAHLLLRVSDDGQGFAEHARRKPESFGLLGMHERVRVLGGSVRVYSLPGAGTTVEVILPPPVDAAPDSAALNDATLLPGD